MEINQIITFLKTYPINRNSTRRTSKKLKYQTAIKLGLTKLLQTILWAGKFITVLTMTYLGVSVTTETFIQVYHICIKGIFSFCPQILWKIRICFFDLFLRGVFVFPKAVFVLANCLRVLMGDGHYFIIRISYSDIVPDSSGKSLFFMSQHQTTSVLVMYHSTEGEVTN